MFVVLTEKKVDQWIMRAGRTSNGKALSSFWGTALKKPTQNATVRKKVEGSVKVVGTINVSQSRDCSAQLK